MSILDEFHESYLHYTVAQRLFEDRCRQLIGFKGGVDQRQALVDETLRLAMCVTDNIDDTESLIPETLEFLHSENGDPDIIQAISYIANNLKEDRARAGSYSNFITYRRIGNRTRKPRKPQIANPFTPIVDDDPVEAIVIPPKSPGDIIRMTMDGESDEDETADETEDVSGDESEEVSESAFDESDEDADEQSDDDSDDTDMDDQLEDDSSEEGRNPLAVESERIAKRIDDLDPLDILKD